MKILYLTIFLIFTTMATEAQEKSDQLKKAEEEAAIAKLKQQSAESELAIAKSKQDMEMLSLSNKKSQAESDKAIADLNKAITDANKAATLSDRDLYKGPEITAPSGKITATEGAFIESRVLAQKTLKGCMLKLCDDMRKKFSIPASFVIYNASDYKGLELYTSFNEQLKEIKRKFAIIDNKVPGVLAFKLNTGHLGFADPLFLGYAASGILRTAADLTSLFRTTTDYKNFELTIDENMVTAAFQSAAIEKEPAWKIFNPAIYPINTVKGVTTSSPIIQLLNDLAQYSAKAENNIVLLKDKIKDSGSQLEKEQDGGKKIILQDYISDIGKLIVELTTIKDLSTKLSSALSTPDATTSTTPLIAILRAERLFVKLAETNVYTIKFNVVSKGSNKTSESLWRSAKITFSAGTEVSAVVYDSDGSISYAGNMIGYIDFTDSENITGKLN